MHTYVSAHDVVMLSVSDMDCYLILTLVYLLGSQSGFRYAQILKIYYDICQLNQVICCSCCTVSASHGFTSRLLQTSFS